MIRTLIVDDETIMRVTMRSLLDWECHGYTIAADCVSGAQALDYLRCNDVDLLITDMKMPGMTGLELIEQLRASANMPVTVVLSGYNEFELVREAFRLGVYDYLLKADLNESSLGHLLNSLRQRIFTDAATIESGSHRVTVGTERQMPETGDYAVAVFSVDSFAEQAARFGSNLRQKLELPMLELARQIPRIAGHTTLRAIDPSRYELCYHVRDRQQCHGTVTSVVRQLQVVWRDYMNLSVSAAVSDVVAATGVAAAAELCELLLKQTVLYGHSAMVTQWDRPALTVAYTRHGAVCDALIEALCTGEVTRVEEEKTEFFGMIKQLKEDRRLCYPVFLVRLCEKMREYGQDFFELFPEQTDYYAVLAGLPTDREQELWLRNFLRRAQDCFAGQHRRQQPDAIKKARLFMEDNYTNPELTLRTVADYVGYNEKYLSTRFAKECGCTFIAFLNQLRLRRAQLLLTQTGLRMYEISEYVGYNNVEHFNHTFKRLFGISPSDYRSSATKT